MNSEDYARHRREVEDRMLWWKCRVENPPRIVTPTLTTANSTPNIRQSPITPKLEEKLPKIFSFENPTGGAGAPRRSPSGRLQTFLRGDPEIRFHQRDNSIFERSIRYQFDKEAIQKYKAELDKQVAEKKKPFSPAMKHSETTDLASIITAKNAYSVIRRWESLPKLNSTDVTRAYVMSPQTLDPVEYKSDLDNQLETKRRIQEQFSNHEKYLSKLHFTSFNNFWGKPGGGAPKTSKKKENLFKLLHNTR